MRLAPPAVGPSFAVLLAACLVLVGCGRERPRQELSFEKLPDTTGLSRGAAIVDHYESQRLSNGAVRVSGRLHLPDSTLLQMALRRPGHRESVAMAQVFVIGGQFDTPPLLGDTGPLPRGAYELELLVHFSSEWQNARVLRETGDGLALRGPGITRARNGAAAFLLTRQEHL